MARKILILAPMVRIAMKHYLQCIANEAQAAGVQSVIIAPKHVDLQTSFPIARIGGGGKIGVALTQLNPLTYLSIGWKIWSFKPDLVHVINGENRPYAIWLLLLAKLFGIRSVLTIHDPVPHPGPGIDVLTFRIGLLSRGLAHDINLHDAFHLADMERSHEKPVHIFPFPDFSVLFPKPHRFAKERIVLFFGRIEPYKGIDNFVSLGLRMAGKARFILAGSGHIPAELMATMRDHSEIFEIHNRFISDTEMIDLMDRSRVALLPYHSATQSAVPAAAASRGAMPIGFAVGGLINQLPAVGGIAVPPEDLSALEAAVEQALDAPLERLAALTQHIDPFVAGIRQLYTRSDNELNNPIRELSA